jgi:Flp pilus assembly pilin Flp
MQTHRERFVALAATRLGCERGQATLEYALVLVAVAALVVAAITTGVGDGFMRALDSVLG